MQALLAALAVVVVDMSPTNDLRQYIEDRVVRIPDSGCWIWTLASNAAGYGLTRMINGQRWRAHRLSWEVYRAPIGNLCVLHRCDVRSCVNPDHLFLGTNADNSADMVAKKRQCSPIGEHHGMAKLSAKDVHAIRSDARIQREIASAYGVSKATVYRIKARQLWAHV